MRSESRTRTLLARALSVLVGLAAWVGLGCATAEPARVLVLHSSHDRDPWTVAVMRGIDAALAETERPVDVWTDYLDLPRQRSPLYARGLRRFLEVKLRERRFDVVVTSGAAATEFMLDHREVLAPGVPIVFCGVDEAVMGRFAGASRLTGLVRTIDLRSTLDVALRLSPGTRRLVFVVPALLERHLVEPLVADYRPDLRFELWDEEDADRLLARAQDLPADAIVVLLGTPWDRAGQRLTLPELAQRMAAAVRVPVYSPWDIALGHGVVGGRLESGFGQGREVGRMAGRLVDGAALESLPPVREGPHPYQFDYRVMRALDLDVARLPAESELVGRPPSLLELHGEVLAWSGAVIAVLGTYIVLLLHGSRARQAVTRALRTSESRFRDFTAASSDLYWELDADLRYAYLSDNFALVAGRPPQEVLGRPRAEILALAGEPHEQQRHHDHVAALRAGEGCRDLVLGWVRADGGHLILRESARPVLDAQGRLVGFRGVSSDVTEQFLAERRLSEQRERESERVAEELDRARDALVRKTRLATVGQVAAGIGHDLRGPLSTMRNALLLLREDLADGAATARHLAVIEDRVAASVQIVDDLAELAQDRPVRKRILELGDLLRQSWERTRGAGTDAEPPSLELDLEPDRFEVEGDPVELGRVFENLMRNALDAMPPGGRVVVVARQRGAEAEIVLRDEGPGFAVDREGLAFEPLFTTKGHGTGLGLAICRQIVERHQGRIDLRTADGAEVRIRLPRGACARREAAAETESS
ncbi:MAG: PAS domain-containing protein [Ectothiorhodospiraceae bacterium]|nr:PAS domain-containing protein [Chromatiales bacterium]MCP5156989.1 PAS domain-containing protein [Ectothiorhodospiraceae bacterium]